MGKKVRPGAAATGPKPKESMATGAVPDPLERSLEAAGCDIVSAKAALKEFRKPFPNGIPSTIIAQWAYAHIPTSVITKLIERLARVWEKEP